MLFKDKNLARRQFAQKDKMPHGHFAPNRTKFWKGDILPQLQNYGGHFAPTLFLHISLAYLGHILGISWAYIGGILGISWAYLGHIFGISRAYLRHFSGISSAYLGHISGISWASRAYLGHIIVFDGIQ